MTLVRKLSRFALSLAMASTAVLAGAAIANAYTPPGSTIATTSGCASAAPGGSCGLTFQLKDAGGNPVTGATVSFTVSGVTGASVSPTTGVTDPGFVSTTFFAGTSGTGTATITASSVTGNNGGTISASTTILVQNANGGLPATSTTPPSTPAWLPALIALALVIVAGGGLALRRMRVTS